MPRKEGKMNIPVVINYIGQVETVGNDKRLRRVKVKQLDTGEELEVSVFLGKGELNHSVGQEVTMDVDSKEYKGKLVFSAGAWKVSTLTEEDKVKILKVEDKKEEEEILGLGYQVWKDDKHQRICDVINVIKELAPEGQQAVAKDIKELIR